ncbi:MAG: double zinc ribbon domain-containing protein [Gemmatimonadota bacterium]
MIGAARRGLRRTVDLLDRLIPAACAGCGAATPPGRAPVCGACVARLPEIPLPHCPRCGFTRIPGITGGAGCGECEGWSDALPGAAAAFLHEPPADLLVHGLKYRGWTALAPWMGARMAGPARRLAAGEEPWLVPVPLSRSRLRERGYNQALLLARGLSAATGWPVAEPLRRGRASASQAGLGRSARARNVRGAYEAVPSKLPGRDGLPPAPSRERAGRALLVDDVLTTGATAAACAEALRAAGLWCLGVVCFARTPPREPGR